MAVLSALKRTPGALFRNPVLLIPVVVLALLQAPMFATELLDPYVAVAISLVLSAVFVLLMPFFQGGIVGMAEEAIDGSTTLDTFLAAGRDNYVSVFGAYLLLLGVNVAIGAGVVLLLVFGLGAAVVADLGQITSSVVLFGGLGTLFLAYLLLLFFVQFYSQAIVLDGFGAVGGLKRSFGVVRANLLATLGYSLVVGAVGGVVGLFASVLSVFLSPTARAAIDVPALPTEWFLGVGVVGGTVTVLLGTVLAIYSVAFYDELTAG